MTKKIILYTKYDLRDFGFIKFNEIYGFESKYIKGSLTSFPTKRYAEKYFEWVGINLEIKDEFWEYMKNIIIVGNYDSFFLGDGDGVSIKINPITNLDVIKIEEYSTIEDLKNMSTPNNIRITYGNNTISSNTERSKRKNLKKCLLELCETL